MQPSVLDIPCFQRHASDMTLSDYMQTKRIKDTDLAPVLGVGRSMVTKLRLRKATPSFDVARKIIELSKGRVRLCDLVPQNEGNHP